MIENCLLHDLFKYRSFTRFQKTFLSAVLLFISNKTWAQSAVSISRIEQSPISTGAANATTRGTIHAEGMDYTTSIPSQAGQPNLNQSYLMSANIHSEGSFSERFEGKADATFWQYVGPVTTSDYSVADLYVSYNASAKAKASADGQVQAVVSQTKWTAGRKQFFWSQVDSDWNLGVWQPIFAIDPLRPEEQGLTGAFYNYKNADCDVLFFASPISIPSIGPDIHEDNGSLVSDSRWYRSPGTSTNLFGGQPTQLTYSLSVPEYESLVGHGGGGMRVMRGDPRATWFSVNAGYKAMNEVLLKYKSDLLLSDVKNQETGEVSVSPVVGYHAVAGFDTGTSYKSWSFVLSYLQDTPQPMSVDPGYIQQAANPMQAVGVHAKTDLESIPVRLNLSYLKIFGGENQDYNTAGDNQGSIIPYRFNFYNAASVKLDYRTSVFAKPFLTSFKYLRDFDQSGTLINTEFVVQANRSLAVLMGADLLGVDNPDQDTSSAFLNQYRANDRIYGGLNYVF